MVSSIIPVKIPVTVKRKHFHIITIRHENLVKVFNIKRQINKNYRFHPHLADTVNDL